MPAAPATTPAPPAGQRRVRAELYILPGETVAEADAAERCVRRFEGLGSAEARARLFADRPADREAFGSVRDVVMSVVRKLEVRVELELLRGGANGGAAHARKRQVAVRLSTNRERQAQQHQQPPHSGGEAAAAALA